MNIWKKLLTIPVTLSFVLSALSFGVWAEPPVLDAVLEDLTLTVMLGEALQHTLTNVYVLKPGVSVLQPGVFVNGVLDMQQVDPAAKPEGGLKVVFSPNDPSGEYKIYAVPADGEIDPAWTVVTFTNAADTLAGLPDATDAADCLCNNAALLGLTDADITPLATYSEAERASFNAAFGKLGAAADTQTLQAHIRTAVMVADVDTAPYTALEAKLRGYTALNLNFTDYDTRLTADGRINMLRDMARQTLTTTEEIMAAFTKGVSDNLPANPGKQEHSGTGGSGSGGSRGSATAQISTAGGAAAPVPVVPPVPAEQPAFTDLQDAPWAAEYITALYREGIVQGRTADTFDPNGVVTREEFVKLLICALGLEPTDNTVAFADVPEGVWYRPYIAAAVSRGIVGGISADSFGSGQRISRQDMAVMCARAARAIGAELPVYNNGITFADADAIAAYAAEAVADMAKCGVVSGGEDGRFLPEISATRAETAKIICGLRNVLKS